jgi:hypothetical protein
LARTRGRGVYLASAPEPHPPFSEATQQEHALLSDGVDDVAYLLVVEHEIDELRDLDVVDGNLGLVPTCDDQVLLLDPLQF